MSIHATAYYYYGVDIFTPHEEEPKGELGQFFYDDEEDEEDGEKDFEGGLQAFIDANPIYKAAGITVQSHGSAEFPVYFLASDCVRAYQGESIDVIGKLLNTKEHALEALLSLLRELKIEGMPSWRLASYYG